MAHKLTNARRSLTRAKEAAQARLQQLDKERREIKASLKSLDAALKALGDSDQKPQVPESSSTSSGPQQRDMLS